MIHSFYGKASASELPNPSRNKHLLLPVLSLTHDIAAVLCANVHIPPATIYSDPFAVQSLPDSLKGFCTLRSLSDNFSSPDAKVNHRSVKPLPSSNLV